MEESSPERRQSERLPVRVPVVLRGIDVSGREFFDRAEIVSVDQRGARIRTRFQLSVGAEVEVQLPSENASKRLRVAWRGEIKSLYEGMVGLEFADSKDSWNLGMLRAQWDARGY